MPEAEVLVTPDGRIAAVAPTGVIGLPDQLEVFELGAAILLPGLVNCHAHPELAMFRGALEDLPFREWILRLVGAKRNVLGPADAEAAALWTMVESVRAGITTIGATEASGAAVGAMTASGVRGVVYQEVFGPDPGQVEESMRALRDQVERLVESAGNLVRIGVSPHAPYTVSDGLYRATTTFAAEAGLPLAAHIAESAAERALVARGEGDFALGLAARGISTQPRARSPVDLLHQLGVLEARPLLIHCVDLDETDLELLKDSGASVAHCPVANAKLGHGVAPVLELLAAGVSVGIGTDSVGSNNRLDLLEEARISSLLQRARHRRPDSLSAPELLRLCTVDGARALGLEDRIGTLEPGKEADLCAVALRQPSTVPSFDPVTALFHSARGSDVVLTVVAGRPLYLDGAFTTIDIAPAREAVEAAAGRLEGVS
jgi:cytosine/adenosine deaminase-related metal-dependent hydrolase